ncbi:NAD(P)H-quinone oxidoreductase [Pseudomonas batumici]|uniref:NAD(P)H-quinone oxidoreductase n=1 Tax=Pseudomonas batumici TaxID=226910 RepID=UPI0030CBFC18
MTAIEIQQPGGPEVLVPTKRSTPQPNEREVLIQIHAAGVNGPDVLQRKGLYAPPPGASDIPGLEIAGEVVATGSNVSSFTIGDQVMALVPGGGYAEYAVADERTTLHLPQGLSMVEAAALPETFMTVWANMFQRGQFKAGDSILIHGGASGIGTTATMLAKVFGASRIFTTVKNQEQQSASRSLGADIAINYTEQDFVKEVMRETNGSGVDVVVDIIGGDYVSRNFQVAAMNGRIVQIGVVKGPATNVDLFPMLVKRLTHIGSTLRSRTHDEKRSIITELESQVWPHLHKGEIKPLIFKTFRLRDAHAAHELMDSGRHIGKIVLLTQP